MKVRFARTILLFGAILLVQGGILPAQTGSQPTKTLVENKVTKNALIAFPEIKFSTIDGKFANFVGLRGGILLNDKFLIGAGGYGLTNVSRLPAVGYGGLVLDYAPYSRDLVHLTVGGLIGGGGIPGISFFVAEPEARLRVNITRWFRISFGGGYRFIGGAGCANSALRGPVATFSTEFKI